MVTTLGKAGIGMVAGRASKRRSRRPGRGLLLMVVGAAAEYFLDPQQGARRRNIARDRGLALVRRGGREAARKADYVAGQAKGVAHAAMPTPERTYDDVTLARKVESELFRASDAPKGSVDVNAVEGVIELRGEVPRQEDVEELGRRAAAIDGVRGVANLLHPPGTPAPSAPPSTPQEVRDRADQPASGSRFARNPATQPAEDEPLIDRAG